MPPKKSEMRRPAAVPSVTAERLLAASVARKSTHDDVAVADQHVTNAQRAKADGFMIPDGAGFRFEDDNTKGSLTSRPGLNALLEVIESGEAPFKRVYVRDPDRLARTTDPRFIFWFEYECKRHGIQLCYSSTEGEHVDYDRLEGGNAIGTFVTSAVENVRTSEEVRMLGRRVNIGLRRKIIRGEWPGGWVPYGTDRWLVTVNGEAVLFLQKIEPGLSLRQAGGTYRLRWNEDQVPVVRRIYDGIEAGRSMRAIAAQLNTDGVPSPGARRAGGAATDPWLPGDVWALARNPLYKGDLVWGRKKYRDPGRQVHYKDAGLMDRGAIIYPGYLPDAPITAEQWEAVQRILDGNAAQQVAHRASKPEFLLTGLVRCGTCGRALTGHTSARVKDGQRVRYYRHLPVRRHGEMKCPYAERYIAADALEGPATNTVAQTLESGVLVTLVRQELERLLADQSSADREQETKTAEESVARVTRSLDQATRGASAASTDEERASYQREAQRLGRELALFRERVKQLAAAGEQLRSAETRLADVQQWVERLRPKFEAGTSSDRKRVVAAILEALRVDFGVNAIELRVRTLPAA